VLDGLRKALSGAEQEVQEEVEKSVTNVHQQFTSQLDFEAQLRAAGFASEEEWRRWLAENQRRTILQQRLIQNLRQNNKLRAIPPTDAQMRQYWSENSSQRPRHAALVTFHQVVIPVRADSVADAKAKALAESLLVAVRHGANFGELAKKYSADSASRAQGGELGWFRRGVMVKNFEDAAFHLHSGEISDIVETGFGYHIIQVERVEPAEIEARHILIQSDITPAQIELYRRQADSVHNALGAGTPFDTLARHYADPGESRIIDALPAPNLPLDYPKTLGTDSTLGLKPVFQIGSGTGRPKFVVLEVTRWQPEGELTFDDVKDKIRDQLGQQLAVQHYLEALRRTTYIDIRF
jgi:parvulin-like peptidyl-prolyl isomerase